MKIIRLTALGIIITLFNGTCIEAKDICKKGQHWDTKKAKCVNDKKSKNNKTQTKSGELTNESTKNAQNLIDAINNNDSITIIQLLSGNTETNLHLINSALDLVPDNSANVRCMASDPDCGLNPTGKVLKSLQAFLEGNNKINEPFIKQLLRQYTQQQIMGSNPATYAPQTFAPSDKFAGNGLIGNYFKASQIATIHDPSGKNKKSYNFEGVTEISSYNDDQAADDLQIIGSFMSSPKCAPGMMCTQVMKETTLYGKLSSDNLLTSNQIPDGKYYRVKGPRWGRPENSQKNNGFRAPDEEPMDGSMNKKMVANQANNQIYY